MMAGQKGTEMKEYRIQIKRPNQTGPDKWQIPITPWGGLFNTHPYTSKADAKNGIGRLSQLWAESGKPEPAAYRILEREVTEWKESID